MAVFPNHQVIKGRAVANFPAAIAGGEGVSVTKSNGVWTIAFDLETIGDSIPAIRYDSEQFLTEEQQEQARTNIGFDESIEAIEEAAEQTAADAVATAADRVQTGLDRTQTNADVVTTNANVVLTNADAAATEADRIQVSIDAGSAAGDAATAEAARLLAENARDAALFGQGVFPSTAAALGLGIVGHGAITGGSGGTNGTFDLAFSGGTGSGGAGRFVVAGNALTQIIITAPGSYTVAPTFDFSASSGLTSAAADVLLGTNVNVGEYFSVPSSVPGFSLIQYEVEAGPVATEVQRIQTVPAPTAIGWAQQVGWPSLPPFSAHVTPEQPFPLLTCDTTTAEYGPNGIVRNAAVDQPCHAYNPITKEYRGIRFNGADVDNIWQRSRTSNSSPTNKVRCTVSSDAIAGTDGTVSADKLVEDSSTNNTHGLTQSITFVSGLWYTFSCDAMAAERDTIHLLLPSARFGGGNNRAAFFTLEDEGTILSDTGNPIRIMERLPNGWYRCWITALCTSSGTSLCSLSFCPDNSTRFYNGDGSSGVYVDNIQINAGEWPSSRTETAGASATQGAAEISIVAANLSSILNDAGMTMMFKGRAPRRSGNVETLATVFAGDDDNAAKLIKNADDKLEFVINLGAAEEVSIELDEIVADQDFCVVAAWSEDDCAASMNGLPPVIATSGGVPTSYSGFRVGLNGSGGAAFDGYVQTFALWGSREDNAQLPMYSRLAKPPTDPRSAYVLGQIAKPALLRPSMLPTAELLDYGLNLGPEDQTTEPTRPGKYNGNIVVEDAAGLPYVLGVTSSATTVGVINVSAQTAVESAFNVGLGSGSVGVSSNKFNGACRLSRTKALFGIYSATVALFFDMAEPTNKITLADWQTDFGVDLSGSQKYHPPIVGFNGVVYFVPDSAENILTYDLESEEAAQGTYGLGDHILGTRKWGRPCLHPSGLIVAPPFTAPTWLVIDTNFKPAKVYVTYFGGGPLAVPTFSGATGNFTSCGVAPDGEIIAPLFDNVFFARVNLEKGKVYYENFGLTGLEGGDGLWEGFLPGPDLRGYMWPLDAREPGAFVIYDHITKTATRSWLGLTPYPLGHRGHGAAPVNNPATGKGEAYQWPMDASTILKVTWDAPFSDELVMSTFSGGF